LECNFSTSTMTERLAAKVTVMDICKQYFGYRMMSFCGFPQITLDGTKNDWMRLKAKATKLLNEKVTKKFGEEWKKSLLPLLDRFICAFDGKIDCLFWNSMVKRGHVVGSGGYSMFHGWINILFPYMGCVRYNEGLMVNHQLLANKFNEPYSDDLSYVQQGLMLNSNVPRECGTGFALTEYPTGLASAPVVLDGVVKMKFLAGFIGYKQDEKTLEITPNVAWCIANLMTDENEINEKMGCTPKTEKEQSKEFMRAMQRQLNSQLKQKEIRTKQQVAVENQVDDDIQKRLDNLK